MSRVHPLHDVDMHHNVKNEQQDSFSHWQDSISCLGSSNIDSVFVHQLHVLLEELGSPDIAYWCDIKVNSLIKNVKFM